MLEHTEKTQNLQEPSKSDTVEILPGVVKKSVTIEFKSDPARFYLYGLITVGGFEELSELVSFVESRNPDLIGPLESLLSELERSKIISVKNGIICRDLIQNEILDINLKFEDKNLFGTINGILSQRAIGDHRSEKKTYREESGFHYFLFPSNEKTFKKVNNLLQKHRAELNAILDENADLDLTDFLMVSVSSGYLQPEDF